MLSDDNNYSGCARQNKKAYLFYLANTYILKKKDMRKCIFYIYTYKCQEN